MRLLLAVACFLAIAAPAHSFPASRDREASPLSFQDGAWWGGFRGTLVGQAPQAMVYYSGDLFIGGSFGSAGGVPGTENVARWDGTGWEATGIPPGVGLVTALGVARGELFVGGHILASGGAPSNYIIRWDGDDWTGVGGGLSGGYPYAMSEWNGNLVVGGDFTAAGGAPAARVAVWDGTSWTALGKGLNDRVWSFTEYDGNLIAGGRFTASGNRTMRGVASWDGHRWQSMGPLENVRALMVYQGELIAAGDFPDANLSNVVRWTGQSWEALGGGTDGWVSDLEVFGGALYAVGVFSHAGGVMADRVARWDGTAWSSVDAGISGSIAGVLATDGTDLVAGGSFSRAGGIAAINLAMWDDLSWSGALSQPGLGVTGRVTAMGLYDTDLVVGGSFQAAGNSTVNGIAEWDGSSWSPLGTGAPGTAALTVYDGDLIAAGFFPEMDGIPVNYIARWDGASWSSLGSGMDSGVRSLAVFNGELYAGGDFSQAGGVPVNRIARWDGVSWQAVGSGVENGTAFAQVRAMLVLGDQLVVAGDFSTAGGGEAWSIATWDGSSWGDMAGGLLGSGSTAPVNALAIWNGDLVAGGDFTRAYPPSSPPLAYLAQWHGAQWIPIGDVGFPVDALSDMNGTLVAGGWSPDSPAFFDGNGWQLLGRGMNSWVASMCPYAGHLYVGGDFTTAGWVPSMHIARWDELGSVGIPDGDNLSLRLHASPNPVRSRTEIVYELDQPQSVSLTVYDVQGKPVRRWEKGLQPAGRYREIWRGEDGRGLPVAAGAYYIELHTGSGVRRAKVVLIR